MMKATKTLEVHTLKINVIHFIIFNLFINLIG